MAFQFGSKSQHWQLPVGLTHYSTYSEMTGDETAELEELAFRHGQYSDSYLVTEPNREFLWSKKNHAVVGFLRVGQSRFLHIAGSVLCAEEAKPAFVRELMEFAKLNKLTILLYHLDERELSVFRENSFQVTRFGVETRIPLAGHSWNGKQYQWVRRQTNFVARQDVVFEELQHQKHDRTDPTWQTVFNELQHVARESLSGRAHCDNIPFFEGQLLQDHLGRRRIFIARAENGRGRIEGFLLCTPMNSGTSWALEMYRKRCDAVKGTVAYLFKHAVETLQEEGCDEVSLCPLPAVNCDEPLAGDSYPVRASLKLWKRFGYALFDINGLLHFKSRFRPEFREMFVCAFPRCGFFNGIRATLAYAVAVGLLNISIPSLLSKLVRWNPKRRTLAAPEIQPAVIAKTEVVPEREAQAA